jgi:glutamate--cysteine ligase
MGRLGYQSDAQSSILASCNSLESYGASLEEALTRVHPPYAAIGLRRSDAAAGEEPYNQLSTTLLQIENEFYGKIRPKCRIRTGERPLHALRERGVEYVEVRLMDLDPFEPVGINAQTMRFLDVFLLHCLLADSPPDTPEEIAAVKRNQHRVAERGREPGLRVTRRGQELTAAECGAEVLRECEPIAVALDDAHGGRAHRDALAAAGTALEDPSATLSARILREMEQAYDNSYLDFVQAHSARYRSAVLKSPLSAEVEARYERIAEDSLAEQRETETSDTVPFETFRTEYLAQDLLSGLRL